MYNKVCCYFPHSVLTRTDIPWCLLRRCTRNYWTTVQAAKPKQVQLAFLPIPYDKPLLFNRMFLILRHVVQSCMKIMFRGLALKCSSFLPKLITGGAFWCALQGSADSNVCMHARVHECVCRDPRECITQQFWQRRRTVVRDPSFSFLSQAHEQGSPQPLPLYICLKK